RIGVISFATCAGLANVVALILVNSVVHAPEKATITSFMAYASAAFLSIVAARVSAHRLTTMIETALHQVKSRIVEKIEGAGIQSIERMGTNLIIDRITENMTTISVATTGISAILPGSCMLLFGILYLVSLSPAACMILLPVQVVCVYLYHHHITTLHPLMVRRAKLRVRFLDALSGLLRGAKEIRLSRARASGALRDYTDQTKTLTQLSTRVNKAFDDNGLYVSLNRYGVLAAIAFVAPQHIALDGAQVAKLVATTLFIWSSIQALLDIYLSYVRANDAFANIVELERNLDGARQSATKAVQTEDPWAGRWNRLHLENVEYLYAAEKGDKPFHLGPVDLTVEPGEVIFFVGGNGSGKSTLLKVLTGLYPPSTGEIRLGDKEIAPENVEAYREMISVIFSDFHLFSKAYGLLHVEPAAVKALLRDLHIDDKTSFEDGQFTTQKLSTGQKKRLAMVIALLDDRPLLVLDEWAADQDPEFRKHFYEDMIPALKRKGKTILAVSHDDRYFHLADRVFTLEEGRIRATKQPLPQGATDVST
ncbi:MAG TPA: cyclic peptide export ABC transporter, partial [Polyangium sp.]|nr:cyclic peptide export ABC transporter [Polyangium sp.]